MDLGNVPFTPSHAVSYRELLNALKPLFSGDLKRKRNKIRSCVIVAVLYNSITCHQSQQSLINARNVNASPLSSLTTNTGDDYVPVGGCLIAPAEVSVEINGPCG